MAGALGAGGAGGAGGQSPDTHALMMSMLGMPSPIPLSGFGGQEGMREMLRAMMAKNPADPMPMGMPPSPISEINKMLLASYGQDSALTPPGNKPPAVRPNVLPMSA